MKLEFLLHHLPERKGYGFKFTYGTKGDPHIIPVVCLQDFGGHHVLDTIYFYDVKPFLEQRRLYKIDERFSEYNLRKL